MYIINKHILQIDGKLLRTPTGRSWRVLAVLSNKDLKIRVSRYHDDILYLSETLANNSFE